MPNGFDSLNQEAGDFGSSVSNTFKDVLGKVTDIATDFGTAWADFELKKVFDKNFDKENTLAVDQEQADANTKNASNDMISTKTLIYSGGIALVTIAAGIFLYKAIK
jgi:hypothetical protein